MRLTRNILPFLSLLPFVTARYVSVQNNGLRENVGTGRSGQLMKRGLNYTQLYPTQHLKVPIDHFHNETNYSPHTNETFDLRYWFDASHYKEGGPVVIFQGGEASAEGVAPWLLQAGIMAQLIQATHGIGVILEHRYYGESVPTPDFSTDNLRFLTTEQAMADEAYFAQHVVFKGLEDKNLTAPNVAYIGYGASYAGAFNAFLRIQYPEVFWGAISSSAVTKSWYNSSYYWEAAARYGPPECISTTRTLTNVVDNILLNNTAYTQQLKTAFGLQNITRDDDFAMTLAFVGIDQWQLQRWDPYSPPPNYPNFANYCNNITTSDAVLYPISSELKASVQELITAGGHTPTTSLTNRMLNNIGYMNVTLVAHCKANGFTQDQCTSTELRNASYLAAGTDLKQSWRPWRYQKCTQWGYQKYNSLGSSDPLPIVSRLTDSDKQYEICKGAFNITTLPDTKLIDKYGGYNISYPRLAFVDGEKDNWRPLTPHGFAHGAKDRVSTASEPFMLIKGGVHGWDVMGLLPNKKATAQVPQAVADTQKFEVQVVQEWMQEWQLHCLASGSC